MAASKIEQILKALRARLETVPGAKVERNTAVPEKVPAGGLIVLRDDDPGEPEQALGGFGSAYYSHAIEVEVYDEAGDAAFAALLGEIGTVLDADPTLGGLAFGMTYGRPDVDADGVAGAPVIKAGTIIVTVEYETESPLG